MIPLLIPEESEADILANIRDRLRDCGSYFEGPRGDRFPTFTGDDVSWLLARLEERDAVIAGLRAQVAELDAVVRSGLIRWPPGFCAKTRGSEDGMSDVSA